MDHTFYEHWKARQPAETLRTPSAELLTPVESPSFFERVAGWWHALRTQPAKPYQRPEWAIRNNITSVYEGKCDVWFDVINPASGLEMTENGEDLYGNPYGEVSALSGHY